MEFVAPLLETTEEDWDAVVRTNLKGTYLMSQAAIAEMLRTGGGVIVNNASDAGLRGIRVNAAYSSSKAAIIHLTRSISLDYAGKGIRCNCICPGCIRTPLCERFNAEVGARHGKTGEEVLQEFVEANIPMQRVGTPEEVASVVLFLCSDEARYINGAIIPIDGGLTAGM
jgi:NAD(P)-dependent dehydrogenase (short-subunit alcohol dehydrogenase family)